jgi:hypothetical protein
MSKKPTVLLTFALTPEQLQQLSAPAEWGELEHPPIGVVTHANDLTHSKWCLDKAAAIQIGNLWRYLQLDKERRALETQLEKKFSKMITMGKEPSRRRIGKPL